MATKTWQDYVDQQMLMSGCITQGAIFGHEGYMWAASPFFVQNMPEELGKEIVGAVVGGDASKLQSGVTMGETKFRFVNGSDGKYHLRGGAMGLLIRKTEKTVLMGIYEGQTAPAAGVAIDKLTKWLISSGF